MALLVSKVQDCSVHDLRLLYQLPWSFIVANWDNELIIEKKLNGWQNKFGKPRNNFL
jgi:hypothetical protein